MMGKLRGITLPGIGYDNISSITSPGINVPYTTGLLGSYFLSSLAGNELKNYANPSLPLTRVGSPQPQGAYSLCDKNNCYNTGISSQTTMSVIAVSRRSASSLSVNQGMVVSNFLTTGGVPGGDSLRLTNSTVVANTGIVGGVTNAIATINSNVPAGDFVIQTAQFNTGSSVAGFYDPVTNSIVTASSSGTGRVLSSNNLLIGGHYDTTAFQGVSTPSVVLIYSGTISVPNYVLICNYLRFTFGPQWGIW
ncbi:hypothetical protein [Serratia nevei]|uniref:hypothetical protein n=1 Tax=Serratia nevei TaxID=2703794 RepID=UPI00249BF06D|nr:hypothetical protein [Serratia nevei]MDI3148980.1 hypothetical protein [Serratia nevei]